MVSERGRWAIEAGAMTTAAYALTLLGLHTSDVCDLLNGADESQEQGWPAKLGDTIFFLIATVLGTLLLSLLVPRLRTPSHIVLARVLVGTAMPFAALFLHLSGPLILAHPLDALRIPLSSFWILLWTLPVTLSSAIVAGALSAPALLAEHAYRRQRSIWGAAAIHGTVLLGLGLFVMRCARRLVPEASDFSYIAPDIMAPRHLEEWASHVHCLERGVIPILVIGAAMLAVGLVGLVVRSLRDNGAVVRRLVVPS